MIRKNNNELSHELKITESLKSFPYHFSPIETCSPLTIGRTMGITTSEKCISTTQLVLCEKRTVGVFSLFQYIDLLQSKKHLTQNRIQTLLQSFYEYLKISLSILHQLRISPRIHPDTILIDDINAIPIFTDFGLWTTYDEKTLPLHDSYLSPEIYVLSYLENSSSEEITEEDIDSIYHVYARKNPYTDDREIFESLIGASKEEVKSRLQTDERKEQQAIASLSLIFLEKASKDSDFYQELIQALKN
jgi:hypothetical protein